MGINFIDSVARGWAGGWRAGRGMGMKEGGGKTNLYRLFGVATYDVLH